MAAQGVRSRRKACSRWCSRTLSCGGRRAARRVQSALQAAIGATIAARQYTHMRPASVAGPSLSWRCLDYSSCMDGSEYLDGNSRRVLCISLPQGSAHTERAFTCTISSRELGRRNLHFGGAGTCQSRIKRPPPGGRPRTGAGEPGLERNSGFTEARACGLSENSTLAGQKIMAAASLRSRTPSPSVGKRPAIGPGGPPAHAQVPRRGPRGGRARLGGQHGGPTLRCRRGLSCGRSGQLRHPARPRAGLHARLLLRR